ncbi:ORF6N domain-containing protein [Niallia circulans]|uniref:ORF6N domain-containing protein n=1 Tax=Niallia circulans TaxID=1397 RepID=UPI003D9987E7
MDLTVINHNNQRVLTTALLAEAYGADKQQISKNFTRNANRYKEGKHYFALTGEDKRNFLNHVQIDDGSKNANTLYLWTEKGAWLHAKSLNTDAAWDAYEKLVDEYYSVVKVLSDKEQLIASIKLTIEHEEKFNEYDGRLSKLEDNVRIDSFEQNALQKQIKKRVYKVFETANPNGLDLKKLFPCIHRNFRDAFGVPTYRDLRKLDYEEAISWVKTWRPLI